MLQIATPPVANHGALPCAPSLSKHSYRLDSDAPKWHGVHDTGEVLVTYYGRSAIVHHLPIVRTNGGQAGVREVIRDQSSKSRRNCAMKFGNADCVADSRPKLCQWIAMLALTWHEIPAAVDVKSCWKKFVRRWRLRFGEPPDAWLMEMQERGAPHFHIFICAESVAGQAVCELLAEGSRIETVAANSPRGNGRMRQIVGGNFARGIARDWLECTGQCDDEHARWWHEDRGIVEIVDSPDAAGKYVAKESSKRQQKELPAHYAEGLGQWWRINPRWKPRPRARGFVSLDDWPFPAPYAVVWESGKLAVCHRGQWPIERDKEASPFVSAWLSEHGAAIPPASLDAAMLGAIRARNAANQLCGEVNELRSESEIAEDYEDAVASMAR